MRSGKSIAALAVLLALLTGCGPKEPVTTVSPAAQAPPLPPERMVALLSPMPPPLPAVTRPLIKLDTNAPAETKIETASSEPHRSTKHHNRPAGTPETADVPKTAQGATPPTTQNSQAANVQPPEMSPIGQLSTANDNSNTADRRTISDLIDSTENGLNAIKRPLNADEQKTATLIRTYITRARMRSRPMISTALVTWPTRRTSCWEN